MKFWLENMVLWYREGGTRELTFKNNAVNVITGDSLTGKTAILQVFDYCFFASHSKLPENTINENVAWYGVRFHINDKLYTIARTSLAKGKATDGYYFSASGEIPESPEAKYDEATLKAIIEPEFGIDRNVTIPFGGKTLKLGSKISLRYFLLFNTISEDIITSSTVFFDKQEQPRYAEALPRVFDLACGIERLSNLLARDEQNRLEGELRRLSRQANRLSTGETDFQSNRVTLIRRAKELGLLSPDTPDIEAADALQQIATKPPEIGSTELTSSRQSELRSDLALRYRVVRNLRLLRKEYDEYRKMLGAVEDSLRPVAFLRSNLNELVQTSIFDDLLKVMEVDLGRIKKDVRTRVPIDTNIGDLIAGYQAQIDKLRDELDLLPADADALGNEREKLLFVGELRAKLEIYGIEDGKGDLSGINERIAELEKQLAETAVADNLTEREMFLKLLEEIILEYIKMAGPALGNYRDYLPVFDYKSKTLHLRKPRTSFTENVGSSSNHMLLHLFLFLALQESFKIQQSPFVPPILFIDQPSRPYWGDGEKKKEKLDNSDEEKMRKAFEIMDAFIGRMATLHKEECQLIVFEHVPPSTWDGLQNVHLVERFTDGNALIKLSE
ncbi:MAG: DUF3732 domain-containing protein [Planctomycetaceae bacterium]|nr:DUF3732 domain-containing protein [Planctomycetaceae bacterium]